MLIIFKGKESSSVFKTGQLHFYYSSTHFNLIHFDELFHDGGPFPISTAQKMKFSVKDFFSKYDQILNGRLHFLCSEYDALLPW